MSIRPVGGKDWTEPAVVEMVEVVLQLHADVLVELVLDTGSKDGALERR